MGTSVPDTDLVVGVLGGLGPEATLDFFGRVLRHTPARIDQEHLHLIIDDNPRVPDRNAAIARTGPSPGPALAAMARRLAGAGADFLVMPCNAAHAWEDEIRAATALPFASIIRETCDAALALCPAARRIGVLAVDGCRGARLYESALERLAVQAVTLPGAAQSEFMHLVGRIKAGDHGPRVREAMLGLAQSLIADGAEAVIAGCTEVPLVLEPAALARPLLDSTEVLARQTVHYARRELPLPGERK